VNFLAHTFLSGENEDLIIGNFIADSVKGKEINNFRIGIQKGIYLHRQIDSYTDTHTVVGQVKEKIRPFFGKYAPVVADIYFDHFLAFFWNDYSNQPLKEYSRKIYQLINQEKEILPQGILKLLPYMEKDDWLYNYHSLYGMEQAFKGMSRRAKFQSNMEDGVKILTSEYSFFEEKFKFFFPELKDFSNEIISKL